MKFLFLLLLATPLFGGSAFNLDVSTEGAYLVNVKDLLEAPICYAIKNQKQIELLVDTKEKLSKKEMRVVSKKIVIDPYALGVTKEGKIAVRGNIASEKMMKEVTIKYGQDQFEEGNWSPRGDGYLSAKLNDNIIIDKIINVYVLQESHFDVPKNYKSQKENLKQVICEINS